MQKSSRAFLYSLLFGDTNRIRSMLNNCSKFNFTEKCFVAPLATIVHWNSLQFRQCLQLREGYSIRVYFIQSALKLLITNMPNDNFIFVKYMLFKLFENHNERNRHMREYYRFQYQSAVQLFSSIYLSCSTLY